MIRSSIETRESWRVASVSLLAMACSFGAPWIAVVALKTIAVDLNGARSTPALAGSLAWFGVGFGGIVRILRAGVFLRNRCERAQSRYRRHAAAAAALASLTFAQDCLAFTISEETSSLNVSRGISSLGDAHAAVARGHRVG
jgi:hypothetical protein